MTSTAYQVRGTTDDVTTCQICGKPELRGTVILAILDADGNTEDVTYAGTTCAAKMAGNRTTGTKIRQQAEGADTRRAEFVRFAKEIIAFYEPMEADPNWRTLAYAYGLRNNIPGGPKAGYAAALESLARHRETVATNGLSALLATR
jgi:hypothetical protein